MKENSHNTVLLHWCIYQKSKLTNYTNTVEHKNIFFLFFSGGKFHFQTILSKDGSIKFAYKSVGHYWMLISNWINDLMFKFMQVLFMQWCKNKQKWHLMLDATVWLWNDSISKLLSCNIMIWGGCFFPPSLSPIIFRQD